VLRSAAGTSRFANTVATVDETTSNIKRIDLLTPSSVYGMWIS
jgi:hypothetical protein